MLHLSKQRVCVKLSRVSLPWSRLAHQLYCFRMHLRCTCLLTDSAVACGEGELFFIILF